MSEASASFACFGSRCGVLAGGPGADAAVRAARRRLEEWHDQFTRFDPASELSRLNADPRPAVPVSPVMARLAEAVVAAARATGGLVDATLLRDLETAGYERDLPRALPLELALALAPPRAPAGPSPAARWREICIEDGVVRRPPGLRIDGGGLAKGLFADLVAEDLSAQASFAVDCAGDVRLGPGVRPVRVVSPFDGRLLHVLELADAGAATSGIGARSWLDARGRPAHHLLDPASGRPAFTGVVQVTAVAPTALEAEVRAKWALLGGPAAAPARLPDGGVIVFDDGTHTITG